MPDTSAAITGMHSWSGSRDDYGRTTHSLYATVQRDGAEQPGWGTQVVVTRMPKTYTELFPENRYMVTNLMIGRLFGEDWRNAAVSHRPTLAEAKAHAEELVAQQQGRTA